MERGRGFDVHMSPSVFPTMERVQLLRYLQTALAQPMGADALAFPDDAIKDCTDKVVLEELLQHQVRLHTLWHHEREEPNSVWHHEPTIMRA